MRPGQAQPARRTRSAIARTLIRPKLSDSFDSHLPAEASAQAGRGPLGSAVRRGRRKKHPGFDNAPGVSITPSQAAAAVSVVGRSLPGLSGTI
jgi:hypothetical protein